MVFRQKECHKKRRENKIKKITLGWTDISDSIVAKVLNNEYL